MTASCQEFEVTVHTSPGPTCGTFNGLWLSLIGSQGETPPISVTAGHHLLPGSVSFKIGPLGQLILVRLRLEAQAGFPDVNWHCSRVEVRRPAGGSGPQVFLCDRWLRPADGDVELCSGQLCLMADEREEKLKLHRLKQLQHQQQLIRWRLFVSGAPQCADLSSMLQLGPNLINPPTLSPVRNPAEAHWKEDWFFGYQCLNGCNPLLIRQIRLLPPNLAVTSDMLRPFLPKRSSLEDELKKGTIYLLDYEILDGLPANLINGKQAYLSAPLCLLHLNQQEQLVPIAIQLQHTPGPQNPVFMPSDPGSDWLLAKIWVHCMDFQCHQLISHYLRTHMMAELCCVATLRHLPDQHPLHQLLMPHVRTSLQINLQARASLLAANGVFDQVKPHLEPQHKLLPAPHSACRFSLVLVWFWFPQAVGSGLMTVPSLLSRASARLCYRSLCVPDDLSDRGVDKLPHSFYAQDARRVWDALHR
uniref:Zgc:152891 n=1 Tax=Kryptolebias marmoratus TaxID=37003 RepID=A0A3Q3A9N7_KRYMA